jgi:hypothetical protein
MEKYKLNNQAIVAAVERVLKENNLLRGTYSNK